MGQFVLAALKFGALAFDDAILCGELPVQARQNTGEPVDKVHIIAVQSRDCTGVMAGERFREFRKRLGGTPMVVDNGRIAQRSTAIGDWIVYRRSVALLRAEQRVLCGGALIAPEQAGRISFQIPEGSLVLRSPVGLTLGHQKAV